VLHGFGAWAKPGAKRQAQAGGAGWPGFDPDFVEEPGFIEPYLSAMQNGANSFQLLSAYEQSIGRISSETPRLSRPKAVLRAVPAYGQINKTSMDLAAFQSVIVIAACGLAVAASNRVGIV
jgi:hypothetical protein